VFITLMLLFTVHHLLIEPMALWDEAGSCCSAIFECIQGGHTLYKLGMRYSRLPRPLFIILTLGRGIVFKNSAH